MEWQQRTCGSELRLDEVILAQVVAEEDLLGLVSHRHDHGGEQPGEPDGEEYVVQRDLG